MRRPVTVYCRDCGQVHSKGFLDIDTMEPKTVLDWGLIALGAVMVFALPLALVIFVEAVR